MLAILINVQQTSWRQPSSSMPTTMYYRHSRLCASSKGPVFLQQPQHSPPNLTPHLPSLASSILPHLSLPHHSSHPTTAFPFLCSFSLLRCTRQPHSPSRISFASLLHASPVITPSPPHTPSQQLFVPNNFSFKPVIASSPSAVSPSTYHFYRVFNRKSTFSTLSHLLDIWIDDRIRCSSAYRCSP